MGEDVRRVIQRIVRTLQVMQEAKWGDIPGIEKKQCKSTGHRTCENASTISNVGAFGARRITVAEAGRKGRKNQVNDAEVV